MHRIWIQLKRIADALERISPPPAPSLDETPKKRKAAFVL